MTEANIISNVNIRLNEMADSDVASSEIVSTPYIASLIIPSANNLLMKVPVNAVKPRTIGQYTIQRDGLTGKIILIDDDFLRLHSLEMDSWKKAVSVVHSESSPVYNLQKNIVTRGNPDRPVVIQTHYCYNLEMLIALQFFSVTDELEAIHQLFYITKIVDSDPVFDGETILEDLLIWEIVKTCLIILGEEKKAANVETVMQQTISNLIN